VLPALVSALCRSRQGKSPAIVKEPADRRFVSRPPRDTTQDRNRWAKVHEQPAPNPRVALSGSEQPGHCCQSFWTRNTTPYGPVVFVASAAGDPNLCGGCGAGSTIAWDTLEVHPRD